MTQLVFLGMIPRKPLFFSFPSLFCALFFLTLRLFAQSYTAETYEGKEVASIHATVENLPKQETFYQKPFIAKLRTKVGDPFSQLIFDQDLKTLSEQYDRVEPILTIEGSKLHIEIKLWLKPVIRSILWEGNQRVKTSKLQKELGIKLNTIFNREEFNKAFAKVKDYYIKKGFFESELTYTIIPYRESNDIEIKITVHERQSSHISRIYFNGLTPEEERDILKMITTKRYNFFTSWLSGTGTYREDAVQYDQLIIVNYFQNKGYANAQAQIHISETPGGRIGIHIDVDKGELFHFAKISVEGNTLIDTPAIKQAFGIQRGDLFSPESVQQGVQRIRDLYGKDGYIETKVDHTLQLIAGTNDYDIALRIDEGERFHIGLIRVLGNTSTNSNVILRESLLVPGEVFDSRRLKATEIRLMSTGFFKSVNVYPVKTREDQQLGKNYRDIVIEVEEKATGSIGLFFGYSTQENVIGGLELTESNFDHRGLWKWWREGISSFRGAGELIKLRAQIGAKQQNYTLTWIDPSFYDTPWRLTLETGYSTSRVQSNDYRVKAVSGSLGATYPLNNYWSVGTRWRIRSSTIKFSSTANVQPDERERQQNNEGIVTGLLPYIAYDSTDRILFPTRGFKSTLEGQYAFAFRRRGSPGAFPFTSFAYINSYYYPIWSKGIFSLRCNFQFLFPMAQGKFDFLPINERYFLGGESTVRGYKHFRIGPKFDPLKGKERKKGEELDPKGGVSSIFSSIQYTQKINSVIDIFCFFDAGSLSDKTFNVASFNMSSGIGLNLTLPNGMPLTGGWAFPIHANKNGTSQKDDFQGFFFSMGGQF